MSRSLVLGNGNMLVCLDKDALVRDVYFPYAGQENHAGRALSHKIGVWVAAPGEGGAEAGGTFSWLNDGSWAITVRYRPETMASDIVCESRSLGLTLNFLDIVYNEKNIFIRQVDVLNDSDSEKHVKVFFNQEFRISENEHADTAYYNPNVNAVIHYKGRRVMLVGGMIDGRPFDEYSIGLLGIEGREGTWKDAEDGVLSKNPIEHGAVDSVIGFSMKIMPHAAQRLSYWLCAAETYREAAAFQKYIQAKSPAHLLETTQDYWHAWVNKVPFSFVGLDRKVVSLFKNSLLVIRTHCDDRGGILASGDSGNLNYGRDTYAYIWPRDGAFTALALARAGYHDIAERFYAFCDDVVTDDGYLMHKYQPDRALGSSWHPWVKEGKRQLAIQEDETATVLFAFWEHYKHAKNLEYVERVYNSLIKRCADFLVGYREPTTGLPAPSYDLWEERFGISTFTSASVYGGLLAASFFAALLGKDDDKRKYASEAEGIRRLILEHLYDPETKYFHKLVSVENGVISADRTFDSSGFFGMLKFGVLPADDPRMQAAYDVVIRELSRNIPVGGIARYVGDKYLLASDNVPGNPWFITTLWFLQFRIERAGTKEEMEALARELADIAERAGGGAILSEQIHPQTGEHLGVSPLIWSQAEFVSAVISYMERMEKLGYGLMRYPVE